MFWSTFVPAFLGGIVGSWLVDKYVMPWIEKKRKEKKLTKSFIILGISCDGPRQKKDEKKFLTPTTVHV